MSSSPIPRLRLFSRRPSQPVLLRPSPSSSSSHSWTRRQRRQGARARGTSGGGGGRREDGRARQGDGERPGREGHGRAVAELGRASTAGHSGGGWPTGAGLGRAAATGPDKAAAGGTARERRPAGHNGGGLGRAAASGRAAAAGRGGRAGRQRICSASSSSAKMTASSAAAGQPPLFHPRPASFSLSLRFCSMFSFFLSSLHPFFCLRLRCGVLSPGRKRRRCVSHRRTHRSTVWTCADKPAMSWNLPLSCVLILSLSGVSIKCLCKCLRAKAARGRIPTAQLGSQILAALFELGETPRKNENSICIHSCYMVYLRGGKNYRGGKKWQLFKFVVERQGGQWLLLLLYWHLITADS